MNSAVQSSIWRLARNGSQGAFRPVGAGGAHPRRQTFLVIPEGSTYDAVRYLPLSFSFERERNLREGAARLGKISSFQSWSHHHRRRRRRLRQIDRFFIPSYPRARAQRARPLPPSPSAINSRKDCRFHFPFSLPQPDNLRMTTSVRCHSKNKGSELFGVQVVSIVFVSSLLLFSRRVHPSSSGFMPLQGGATIVDSERSREYRYPKTSRIEAINEEQTYIDAFVKSLHIHSGSENQAGMHQKTTSTATPFWPPSSLSLSAHHLKTRITHNVFDLVLDVRDSGREREGWRVIDVVNAVPASRRPLPAVRPSSEIRLHEIQSQPFVRCACPRFKMSRPPSDVQTCNRTRGVTGFHIILNFDDMLDVNSMHPLTTFSSRQVDQNFDNHFTSHPLVLYLWGEWRNHLCLRSFVSSAIRLHFNVAMPLNLLARSLAPYLHPSRHPPSFLLSNTQGQQTPSSSALLIVFKTKEALRDGNFQYYSEWLAEMEKAEFRPTDRQTAIFPPSRSILSLLSLPGSEAATDGRKFERQLDFINPSASALVARRVDRGALRHREERRYFTLYDYF